MAGSARNELKIRFGRAFQSPRWMTRESTERRRATAAARTHAVSEEPRFESIRAFHEHAFDTMSGKRSASEAPADERDRYQKVIELLSVKGGASMTDVS